MSWRRDETGDRRVLWIQGTPRVAWDLRSRQSPTHEHLFALLVAVPHVAPGRDLLDRGLGRGSGRREQKGVYGKPASERVGIGDESRRHVDRVQDPAAVDQRAV